MNRILRQEDDLGIGWGPWPLELEDVVEDLHSTLGRLNHTF